MSMYDNARSADGPKKPIEVLTDRLDGLINQFISFNLAINTLTKRIDALEAKPKATRRSKELETK
jgi:hypothetical protein